MQTHSPGIRHQEDKDEVTRSDRRCAEKAARKLLRSGCFFPEFLKAVKKGGLVGEEQNALVLETVVVSRVLSRPLNAFVKGPSSGGKNFLVTRVLSLMPQSAVAEITSASDRAWNYSGSDLSHKVVYIQEQNEAAGTIDAVRLLISEGKLIRIVTKFEGGKRVTKKYVARGPVAHLLGHASTQILPTYIRPFDENTKALIEAMDAARKHKNPASGSIN